MAARRFKIGSAQESDRAPVLWSFYEWRFPEQRPAESDLDPIAAWAHRVSGRVLPDEGAANTGEGTSPVVRPGAPHSGNRGLSQTCLPQGKLLLRGRSDQKT